MAEASAAKKVCDHCGVESSDTKICAVCKTVRYCGRDCQRQAWKTHKENCKKPPPPSVKAPYTTNARLTDPDGQLLDAVLMNGRHVYNWCYAATEHTITDFPRDDLDSFFGLPRGDMRLYQLNARMLPIWETDYHGIVGNGVYRKVAQMFQGTQHYAALRRYARHWGRLSVTGSFYVVEKLPSGTIMVHADTHKVYLVLGMGTAVFDTIAGAPGPRPLLCGMTLLPWMGHVVYDGIVVPGPLMTQSPAAAARRLSPAEVDKIYRDAEKAGEIISRIKVPKDDGVDNDVIKPAAGVDMGTSSGAAAGPADENVVLKPKEIELAKFLRDTVAKGRRPQRGVSLIFRRYGYTPTENPQKILVAMWMRDSEMCQEPGMLEMKRHLPTLVEVLQYLKGVVKKGRSLPESMSTDHLALVPLLRKAMEGPGMPSVQYYPPPSAQEKSMYGSW